VVYKMTKLKVDKSAIEHNLAQIKKCVGNDVAIMPIIKSNAYGAGLKLVGELVKDYPFVGVANVNEAKSLLGIISPEKIFILYQPSFDDIGAIAEFSFTIAVCEVEFLEKLNDSIPKTIDVHLSLDTGLGSTGINCTDVQKFCEQAKSFNNINVKGAFSQFGAHESLDPVDIKFTDNQVEKFDKAVTIIESILEKLDYKHISCSGAVITRPNDYKDMVRVGCLIYGIYPQDFFKEHIDLKPVFSLSTKITGIKELNKGDMVGYRHAGSFKATKPAKIATIPIGYADGLTRKICDDGYFIVNGKKAKVISISMNICNIDVTGIKANLGDEVTIIDNKNITLENVAEWCDLGFDELMTHFGIGLERV